MRKIIEFLRVFVISPQVCVALAVTFLALLQLPLFAEVGERLLSDQELWKYLVALPGGLLVWNILQSKEILFPVKESNRELIEWPEYWKLKLRVAIGLLFSFLSCILAVVPFVFRNRVATDTVGGLFTMALCIGIITAASLWLAGITVREITEK